MNQNKRSARVLVVEDDEDSRTAICTILESLGYTPVGFPGSKEALAALSTDTNFDIALLDIMMPGMNGYELLAELKKIPALSEVPVIMITAKDADAEVLEGYQMGADYYIAKPFTAKQIEYGLRLFLT